jgi:hypothetical protein
MTRDDIIKLAREADLLHPDNSEEAAFKFAALVAQHEREACAKVCVCNAELYASPNVGWESSMECASAIRARGNA